MRKMVRQKNLLMTALIKSNWKLCLVGDKYDKLWAQYGRKFAIRLRQKNFTFYKRVEQDLIEVETSAYNRRQSQQIKRLMQRHE